MKKKIFDYIRMMRGINDYNQMVKDLMENFNLTKSQAEDYIQKFWSRRANSSGPAKYPVYHIRILMRRLRRRPCGQRSPSMNFSYIIYLLITSPTLWSATPNQSAGCKRSYMIYWYLPGRLPSSNINELHQHTCGRPRTSYIIYDNWYIIRSALYIIYHISYTSICEHDRRTDIFIYDIPRFSWITSWPESPRNSSGRRRSYMIYTNYETAECLRTSSTFYDPSTRAWIS